MARNKKWIDSQPDDSVERVARRALDTRLKRVWYFLEAVVEQPASEVENVHQLRVFARRAAAALEIFGDWLPKRRASWIDKQLKRLRKAAGDARDLDVLWLRWSDHETHLPAEAATCLLEQVRHRRRAAQRPIGKVYRKLRDKRFAKRTEKFLRRIRASKRRADGDKFACVARTALGRLAGPYLAAGEGPLPTAEALHAFRIQGKQVRYAMEIFAGAFDAGFREQLYPLVADLQDRLGAINDHVTAEQALALWREETDSSEARESLAAGMQYERQQFERSRQEFLAWWTIERRENLRRQFARFLPISTDQGE